MSTTVIIALVVAIVIALFFVWVWVMNRLDERREKHERQAARAYYRGLP